jgi:magnesium-transporting ATPase (P-type)
MKYLNNILLWVLAGVSVVVLVLFGMAETENVQLTNGQFTEVSTQLDTFITWMTVAVGFGLILLPISIAIDAILGKRWSLLIVVASVVVLYFVCNLLSGEQEFSRVVNGETQVFTESTMKMIDAWLYSIYALVGVTVLLIVGFGLKRAILK